MAQDRLKKFFNLESVLYLLELKMKRLESSLKEVPLDVKELGYQLDWMVSNWSEVSECYNCLGVLTQ